MRDFVARRDVLVDALVEIGTWPAKEHVKAMQKLWPAKDSSSRTMGYLSLQDGDPLIEPLTVALVTITLESS